MFMLFRFDVNLNQHGRCCKNEAIFIGHAIKRELWGWKKYLRFIKTIPPRVNTQQVNKIFPSDFKKIQLKRQKRTEKMKKINFDIWWTET